MSDCRRVLQLQYFGEVFDHNRCGEIANMKCDNCTRNAHSTIEKGGGGFKKKEMWRMCGVHEEGQLST